MNDELSAISVGLSVNLGSLDKDIANIQKKVAKVEGDHVINFTVGKVDVKAVERQLRELSKNALPIMLNVTVARGSAAVLRRELLTQLRSGGPVPIQIKANLSVTEVNRIRSEITQRLGNVTVNARGAAGPAASGGGTSASAPLTAHERRAHDDIAQKVGRAVRSGSGQPGVAHAAPTPPTPASAPTAASPAAQRASTGGKTRSSRAAAPPPAAQAKAPADTAPAGAPPSFINAEDVARPTSGSLAARLRRKSEKAVGRRVSPDELKAQSRRVATPETPEEIEYASRPTAVSLPGDAQTEFEQEKRSRGVRGASRSGARQRNEPVLLPSDYQSRDIQQDDNDTRISAERNAAVRAPARKSNAFFGSREKDSPLNPILNRLQFYRFAPELGEAFKHVEAGDTDAARSALRGFSARLSTADPRERKKFFRLFRNVENVPPELLEKHAAVQGLFAQINQQDADRRLSNTEAVLKGVDKKAEPEKYAEALGARQAAKKFQEDVLRGLKHRAGGGPVEGGLLARIAAAKMKNAYLVNEHREETFFGKSGAVEIIKGGPQVRTFPEDGEIKPFVPEWVRRGMAKDLTHRDAGGSVRGPDGRYLRQGPRGDAGFTLVGQPYFDPYPDALRTPGNKGGILVGQPVTTQSTSRPVAPPTPPAPAPLYKRPPATEYEGQLAAEPGSGLGGRKKIRDEFPGERAAIAKGGLSPTGGVQRVFVTNWPASGGSGRPGFVSNPSGAGLAAGPLRFSDKEANSEQAPSWLKALLGNTAVASPAKAEKETPVGPVGAFERQQARQRARGAAASIEQSISESRSSVAEARQVIPVRSLSVAVGQIFSTIFGGRGDAITRANRANELAAKATVAVSNFKSEQAKLLQVTGQLRKAENPKQQTDLLEKVKDQAKATRAARNEAEGLAAAAKDASKNVVDAGGAIRNLAAGTIGVVAGTIGFGAALGVAQLGIQAITTVAQPAIDRLTGFVGTSDAVTSALGDQIKAQNGAADSAFAMTAANAGLSKSAADLIGPLVTQRAAVEEGNKQLGAGLDLLHSFEDARRRGGQQGLFSTTGGLLGTSIGGTASTQEIVNKELTAPEATGTGVGGILSGGYDPKIVAAAKAAQAAGEKAFVNPITGQISQTVDVLAKATDQQSVLNDRIAFFNDAIQKGGESMKFVAGASDDVAKKFASAADRAGLTEIGNTARSANKVILVDSSGAPVLDPQKIVAAISALNTGQNTPDPALLIKQLTERVIPAQRSQFRAEAGLQRTLTTGQFALGQLASPLPGTKGGPSFESGIVGKDALTGKIDKEAAAAASKYKSLVGDAVTYVNDQIQKGHEALLNLVPSDTRQEFSGLLDQITATGKQIATLQSGIQQEQVNLQVAEYNNQLRIARRSLQDAKDLQAGIAGATKDTLGGLEGENQLLNRQLQLLGFELQQRQINFRLATAGFVAPGTTPEETAARIEEAKKEAAFAQKQLDIQKQLANNQFKGIKISASRDVTDLLAQIGLLERGKTVTVHVAAESRAIDLLNAKEQNLISLAGTYIEEGSKITTAALQAASQVEQQTGKDFGYILTQTANAWGIFGSQAQLVLNALKGSAPNSGSGTGARTPGQAGGPTKAANGIVGDTLGPTQLTVGEAAGEKVAVLRNPHLVPASVLAPVNEGPRSSGGSVNLTVIVTGNQIKDEQTVDQLVRRVADKVEEKLNQRASLFGLGGR